MTENVVHCATPGCTNVATHTNFITFHDGFGIIRHAPCCEAHRFEWNTCFSAIDEGPRPRGWLVGVFTNRNEVNRRWRKKRDELEELGLITWRR